MNNTISNKDTEINDLKNTNEILITANGNLLQQVGVGEEPKDEEKEKEDTKPKFSFKNAFDEKGNFK